MVLAFRAPPGDQFFGGESCWIDLFVLIAIEEAVDARVVSEVDRVSSAMRARGASFGSVFDAGLPGMLGVPWAAPPDFVV